MPTGLEKAASIKNGAMRLNQGAKLNLTNVKAQLAWFQAQGLVSESITIDQLGRKLRRNLLIDRAACGRRAGPRHPAGVAP